MKQSFGISEKSTLIGNNPWSQKPPLPRMRLDQRGATPNSAAAIDDGANAKLVPLVRSLARQAARQHLRRRGYTVLLIPGVLAFISMLLMAALILGNRLGGY